MINPCVRVLGELSLSSILLNNSQLFSSIIRIISLEIY